MYAFQDQSLCSSIIVLNQMKERLEDYIEIQYFFWGGGTHSPEGEGLGESRFRRLEKSLALCLLCGKDKLSYSKFSFALLNGHNHERSSNFFCVFCTFDAAVFIIEYQLPIRLFLNFFSVNP